MGSKLFFYLFKKKLVYLLVSLLILTVTVQIVDLIELTRSNIGKENFSFERVIKMSLLKTPFLINEIMPFIIIVSTSFFFKYLVDNNELISIRNLGLSILNIFYPVGLAVLTLGILSLIILNPISSVSMNYYQILDGNNKNSKSTINLDDNDIWIKNYIEDRIIYINSKNMNIENMSLDTVMVIDYNKKNSIVYFAEKAFIEKEFLKLQNVTETNINLNKNITHNIKNININFIQKDILNSIKYYKYTPFYKFYNYIKSMKKLNYLNPEIILYFLSEIFKPILLISIAFVVTGYVSKFNRNESFFKTIFIAIIIGFILFLIDRLIYSIDINNIISYCIVILTIPILSFVLGTILIINVEKS